MIGFKADSAKVSFAYFISPLLKFYKTQKNFLLFLLFGLIRCGCPNCIKGIKMLFRSNFSFIFGRCYFETLEMRHLVEGIFQLGTSRWNRIEYDDTMYIEYGNQMD